MKYLFFICIISFLFLSCENSDVNKRETFRNFDEECENLLKTEGLYGGIKEFSYKGHDYIEFSIPNAHGRSVVHNPECKNPKCIK